MIYDCGDLKILVLAAKDVKVQKQAVLDPFALDAQFIGIHVLGTKLDIFRCPESLAVDPARLKAPAISKIYHGFGPQLIMNSGGWHPSSVRSIEVARWWRTENSLRNRHYGRWKRD